MIRRRLLRAAGWTAMSVPWYEWFCLPGWPERLEYLAAALEKADASLADHLRPATGELLSSDFRAGPGEVSPERGLPDPSSVTASGSFDEGGGAAGWPPTAPRAGYTPGGGGAAHMGFAAGLMDVLARGNVGLTQGAVRRLQNMGLGGVVQSVRDRRGAVPELDDYDDASDAAGGGFGGAAGGPPVGDPVSGLLPKPALPRMMRAVRVERQRFRPRFADSKRPPSASGDHVWGLLPSELEPWRGAGQDRPSPPPPPPAPFGGQQEGGARPAARAAAQARGAGGGGGNAAAAVAAAAAADAVIAKVLHQAPSEEEAREQEALQGGWEGSEPAGESAAVGEPVPAEAEPTIEGAVESSEPASGSLAASEAALGEPGEAPEPGTPPGGDAAAPQP
jgi:hypothetical protein